MSQSTLPESNNKEVQGITKISVQGFKSLYDECSIEIRPLTILAGANSSGKSSSMQPLLLMKQTLEATYDPGALLLNGPNVRFTSVEQILSKKSDKNEISQFNTVLELKHSGFDHFIQMIFEGVPGQGIDIIELRYKDDSDSDELEKIKTIKLNLAEEEIKNAFPDWIINNLLVTTKQSTETVELESKKYTYKPEKLKFEVRKNRISFTLLAFQVFEYQIQPHTNKILRQDFSPADIFMQAIHEIIYIPGSRKNPERNYKNAATASPFSGTFEDYVASLINQWQKTKDERLVSLGKALEMLGLTWTVEARQINDVQIELRVGRLSGIYDANDMVSIADVGIGVSQVLPVLVALLVAKPGQLVYIEQPELHLHPRAQAALANILADAAKRGVRVVIETHSELLLLAVQSLVAERQLSPDLVKLHWFTRGDDGMTTISSADLDEAGAFGDFPEDFSDVSLKLESRYLNAAESRLSEGSSGS
ncbi:MAG: AAA family ATPase [Coleofasciculus sp. G3-WIS-01]|uniref:AAA family ATPase n=1 Tax=Coleofasciculus sp. G3-WIS-01 TaxID=3069528 RepID=UPI003303D666